MDHDSFDSTPFNTYGVEVIGTSPVPIRYEGIVCRQTPMLEYRFLLGLNYLCIICLNLVPYTSLSVLCPFVGGGYLVCLSPVSRAGGGGGIEHTLAGR